MKIHSPNRSYSGISASVQFKDGVGETTDPNLIGWFQDHGYEIELTAVNVTGISADGKPEVDISVAVGPLIPINKPKRTRKDAAK